MFAAGAHLAAPEATLEGVHEALAPAALVGCGAAGVIGEMREVEHGTAVSVWAAALDGGEAATFHSEVESLGESEGVLSGIPELAGAAGVLLLADPFTFPTDAVLRELSAPRRCCRCWAALPRPVPPMPRRRCSSARRSDGGAVGVRFDGVEILPCVSQGAAPIGPELTITACEGLSSASSPAGPRSRSCARRSRR